MLRPRRKLTYPRTLGNSQVRDYSWPCILVLVREWIDESDFGKPDKPGPWQILPKRIDLPDGRSIPVCTVLAPPIAQKNGPAIEPVAWPKATFGGGLPLYVDVQHETHLATIGCLVSDGHTTYALTARHACGEPGTKVSAMLREGLSPIGVSSNKQITRKLFSEVYPALPLRQTWLGARCRTRTSRRCHGLDAKYLRSAAYQGDLRHLRTKSLAAQADRQTRRSDGCGLGTAPRQDQGDVLPLPISRRLRLCVGLSNSAGGRRAR